MNYLSLSFPSCNLPLSYENRCKCKELSVTKNKKVKVKKLSEGRPLKYFKEDELEPEWKVFQMKYTKNLSPTAKLLLNNFQNKYLYYAIDDILYSLQSNPSERDNLLAILYSPVLSLHNNFSINFFNIWIREIYIDEISKTNRFLNKKLESVKQFNYITIKFFYKPSVPVKKKEVLW